MTPSPGLFLIRFFNRFEPGQRTDCRTWFAPVGEDAKAFVDRGGLHRLEMEAAGAAIRRVREAAYPLIFKLLGAEMPRGKERKLVLTRLGRDLSRIEKALGYREQRAQDQTRKPKSGRVRRRQARKRATVKPR